MCFACGSAISKVDFLSNDYEKGVSCSKCINKTNSPYITCLFAINLSRISFAEPLK